MKSSTEIIKVNRTECINWIYMLLFCGSVTSEKILGYLIFQSYRYRLHFRNSGLENERRMNHVNIIS